MTPVMPIRRGTARRLGLRRPPYPRGLIEFPHELSAAEFEEFKARWTELHGSSLAHQVDFVHWEP